STNAISPSAGRPARPLPSRACVPCRNIAKAPGTRTARPPTTAPPRPMPRPRAPRVSALSAATLRVRAGAAMANEQATPLATGPTLLACLGDPETAQVVREFAAVQRWRNAAIVEGGIV